MAVGASHTLDFKSLDRLAKLADKVMRKTSEASDKFQKFSKIKNSFTPLQEAFLDLNISANGIASGLATAALKAPGLSSLFTIAAKTTKAFDDMRKVLEVAFTPLKAAKVAMGGIFSIVRSIAMTPLNLVGGLVGGLKNAFSSMADFASDKVGSWWLAQTQRTDTRSLLALQRTEDTYGMSGMLSTLSETFSSSLRDYSKYGGLLSSGISNEDIGRYQKMDSTEAMFDALSKIRENGIANGYDPNSRSYFDATGMGEAFGISFEQYTKLIEVLPMVTKDFKTFKSLLATNDKIMISTNRTSNQLGVAFDNLKTRLISRFGPALLKLAQTVTPIVDQLSKDVFTNDNVKAFSDWLGKLATQIKDFFKEGGISKLRQWVSKLIDIFTEMLYGMAKGLNFLGLISDDSFKSMFGGYQLKEALNDAIDKVNKDGIWGKTTLGFKEHRSNSLNRLSIDNATGSGALSGVRQFMTKQDIENIRALENRVRNDSSLALKVKGDKIKKTLTWVVYNEKTGETVNETEVKLDIDNRNAR